MSDRYEFWLLREAQTEADRRVAPKPEPRAPLPDGDGFWFTVLSGAVGVALLIGIAAGVGWLLASIT